MCVLYMYRTHYCISVKRGSNRAGKSIRLLQNILQQEANRTDDPRKTEQQTGLKYKLNLMRGDGVQVETLEGIMSQRSKRGAGKNSGERGWLTRAMQWR